MNTNDCRLTAIGVFRISIACTLVALVGVGAFAAPAGAQMAEPSTYVVQLDGRLAFVDKGRGDGLFADQFLQLVRHESIIHPVTGEDLGGEVPLGAARVVEVFEKLATAEIIELAMGMDLETLGMEVGSGNIRVRAMGQEEEAALRMRVKKAPASGGKAMVVGGVPNPEGPLKGLIPDLQVLFGGRVETALPVRAHQLISSALLVQADTTQSDTLRNINGSRQISLGLQMPLSTQLSARAEFGVGSESRVAVGGSYYPGPIFSFLGEGYTPDGQVGAPGFTLMLGSGGRGARSLPQDVSLLIQADSTAVGTALRIDDPAVSDSAVAAQTIVATSLMQQSAEDSLDQISKRGLGFHLGATLPWSDHLTLRTGLTSYGSTKEFMLGATYYLKPTRPNMANTNPDGMLRSLVIGSDLIYDLEISQIYVNLDLKLPISRAFTLNAGILSDLAGISRYGVSLKTYLKGF